MPNRYDKSQIITNNSKEYNDIFDRKKIKNIKQYSSFDFKNLKNLDEYNLDSIVHIVNPYEKLFMISQKYYNSPDYGWLICYTNKISNELNIFTGMPLVIYFPLDKLLELF